MTRGALTAVALAAVCAFPAQAAAGAKVDVMVAGRSRILRAPGAVTLKTATVKAGGKRCRVAARTPLAALARTSLSFAVRDYGSCSRRPADAAALYVRAISGERERGRGGWVYKIGHKAPGSGAGDPASRLRRGDAVLWFWCRNGAHGCQRTLAVAPDRATAAPGSELRVTVTAYDDDGKGIPGAGATVTLGSATAQADADGVATLTVPAQTGTLRAVATKKSLVRSFPAVVKVA